MNNLIPTHQDDEGNILVNGRDLHDFLDIDTKYTDWFNRMLKYGFTEGTDFIAISQKGETAQGNSFVRLNHAMSIDMAKEISMIQRNQKGKQARQYFIAVEKKAKAPMSIPQQIQTIAKGYTELETDVKDLKLDVSDVKNRMGLPTSLKRKFSKARNKKVIELMGGSESNAYRNEQLRRKVYSKMFASFKEQFDVNSYEDCPMKDFDAAIEFVNNWFAPYELQQKIQQLNSQTGLFDDDDQ
jgi:anti-repressor protein